MIEILTFVALLAVIYMGFRLDGIQKTLKDIHTELQKKPDLPAPATLSSNSLSTPEEMRLARLRSRPAGGGDRS
jgi:hypothetical protein